VKIGDKAKIVCDGLVYPTYFKKALEMGATKWREIDNGLGLQGKIGTIKNIQRSIREFATFVLLDLGTIEIIIDMEGLKKIKDTKKKVFGIVKFTKKYYK
jgi:hypothetical protein